jgi:hypothetical protein
MFNPNPAASSAESALSLTEPVFMVPEDFAWEGTAMFKARVAVKLTARIKALYAKFQ